MIHTKHLLKVSVVWMSIVYVVCFMGVAFFPSIRTLFMRYALHADVAFGASLISLQNFVTGLILWDVIAALAVGLFALLFNWIKR